MNALALTHRDFINTMAKLAKPAPSINITPSVLDFGGQSADRLSSLARAATRIADAVHGGQMYAQMLNPVDFAVLKDFVRYLDGEFALLGAGCVRDDKPDDQHSPDESHFLDRERL